jgi:hypothetical protein
VADSQFKKAYDYFRRRLRGESEEGEKSEPKRLLDIIEKRAVRGLLESVSVTKTEDRHYWHIIIQKKLGKFIIRLFGADNGPDYTEYNIGAAAKATVTP